MMKLTVVVLLTALQVAVGLKFACDHPVYCHGQLLEEVQTAEVFKDSKTLVDMSMKQSPDQILAEFSRLSNRTKESLRKFVDGHFTGPGGELEEWTPVDWKDRCGALEDRLKHAGLRDWVSKLNSLWKALSRKIKSEVELHPDRHSLMYVPHPFIIPGDRFREFYYWDSYWIIGGLLVCEMKETTKNILSNFLRYVDQLGHIPNGGRVYYTRRSQPPLLIPMVHQYYQATRDLDFIRDNIHLLEKEYNFWINNRTLSIKDDSSGSTHQMVHYAVDVDTPRPEGYREDVATAAGFPEAKRKKMYSNLASGAESGWDFSSRWFTETGKHRLTLRGIMTSDIIPVDLNSFICMNERLLSEMYGALGHMQESEKYKTLAEKRERAIWTLMWNDTAGAWFDYDLTTSTHRHHFYPSNLFPMFAGCYGNLGGLSKKQIARRAVRYLENEGILDYPGGIPTSKLDTGQQWDYHNAWSPTVHMVIEGLSASGSPKAQRTARKLASVWVNSNYQAWKKYHAMFEKYDASQVGEPGGGGEYGIQVGFGWTNGVVLMLLKKYGDALSISSWQQDQRSQPPITYTATLGIVIAGVVIIGLIVLIVALVIRKRQAQQIKRDPRSDKYDKVHYSKVQAQAIPGQDRHM